jgi:hypothetical protein
VGSYLCQRTNTRSVPCRIRGQGWLYPTALLNRLHLRLTIFEYAGPSRSDIPEGSAGQYAPDTKA